MSTNSDGGRVFAGVIFDLDGTLTQPDAIDFARIRRRIGMPGPGSILQWIDEYAASPDEAESMRDVVWEEEALALDDMELGTGFRDLVQVLLARGASLRTAICTRNNGEAIAAFDALLQRSGLPRCEVLFPVQVAREHHSARLGRMLLNKPSPEPTHEIKHAWGIADEYPLYAGAETEAPRYPDLLFVGDSEDDLLAGRRAGTSAAWMDHGSQSPPSVATHAFANLAECAAVLLRVKPSIP